MIALVEKALDAVLPAADARPAALSQAMRWAVEGGGKRLRPQVCLLAAIASGGRAEDAVWPACANARAISQYRWGRNPSGGRLSNGLTIQKVMNENRSR